MAFRDAGEVHPRILHAFVTKPADRPSTVVRSVDAERIFEGLNAEQRAAVEATRGPVCILAGAGTGKTTTITRRIAWQVASGAFAPAEIVAVTFTDKAAGELRARLGALGVEGVRASTFHSAALALLRRFAGDPGRILSTKALLLRRIGNWLPAPYKFRPAGDLATEIEWAKNRRLTPDDVSARARRPRAADPGRSRAARLPGVRAPQGGGGRDRLRGPARADGARCSRRTSRPARSCASAGARSRSTSTRTSTCCSRRCSTSGSATRDDVCVVGDDYQSIYGFTGASARWLLGLPRRFPNATVVRLEQNYRSTPQVLELANRLVPQLGGAEKTLRANARRRPGAGARAASRPTIEARVDVRVRALDGRPARGEGGARADERARRRLRGGVPRRGASRSRARRCSPATPRGGCSSVAAAASGRRRDGRAATRDAQGWLRRPAREARRARADAAGRPRAARAARGRVRRRATAREFAATCTSASARAQDAACTC